MTSLLDAPTVTPAEVVGVQTPRICSVPPSATCAAADEVIELAAMAGLDLDPWQQLVLREALAEDERGKWAAFEVGLVCSRQNGKGAVLEALELAALFLWNMRLVIHSAHEFATSREHLLRMQALVEGTPMFAARLAKNGVKTAHGHESITLKNGQRLLFKTRTKSGGRGLSGDLVVLDEAMILTDATVGALMPTMSAKAKHGNPQLWYTGSAGTEDSIVLGRLRRRGLSGDDPSLCYMEWSVDEDVYKADPATVAVDPQQIAVGNPGLEIRLTLEHTLREQRSMSPDEYARERLGVGQWPMLDDESAFLPIDGWRSGRDPLDWRAAGEPIAFAVASNFTRTRTSIVAAGADSDGRRFVELIDSRPGVRWAIERLAQLQAEWKPCAIGVQKGSPAASITQDLTDAGVSFVGLTADEAKQACGDFYDLVDAGQIHHNGNDYLTSAAQRADKRDVGDGWLWDLKSTDADITPIIAATWAAHCWLVHRGSGDILSSVW